MKDNKTLNKSLYLVLPVISILVVLAIAMIWVQPKIANILQTQTQIADEQSKQTMLDTKIETLDALSKSRTDLLAQLTDVNIALPTQKDIPALIIQLQRIAQESDVAIQGIQLTPGKLVNDSAPTSKTGPDVAISLGIQGNYESLKTFLGKIVKGKRLINMEAISMSATAADNDGTLTVTLNMNTFYQPLPAKPGDETEEVPVLTKAERDVYENLKTYTAYQVASTTGDASPLAPDPTPVPSATATPSEAPETSPSARPL